MGSIAAGRSLSAWLRPEPHLQLNAHRVRTVSTGRYQSWPESLLLWEDTLLPSMQSPPLAKSRIGHWVTDHVSEETSGCLLHCPAKINSCLRGNPIWLSLSYYSKAEATKVNSFSASFVSCLDLSLNHLYVLFCSPPETLEEFTCRIQGISNIKMFLLLNWFSSLFLRPMFCFWH